MNSRKCARRAAGQGRRPGADHSPRPTQKRPPPANPTLPPPAPRAPPRACSNLEGGVGEMKARAADRRCVTAARPAVRPVAPIAPLPVP